MTGIRNNLFFCPEKLSTACILHSLQDTGLSLLRKEQRIKAQVLFDSFVSKCEGVLIDVRSPEEFEMCAVPHSLNIPLKIIDEPDSVSQIMTLLKTKKSLQDPFPGNTLLPF